MSPFLVLMRARRVSCGARRGTRALRSLARRAALWAVPRVWEFRERAAEAPVDPAWSAGAGPIRARFQTDSAASSPAWVAAAAGAGGGGAGFVIGREHV